ncbi:hypothetical protein N7U49_01890 [Streptomyces sp. AD2-2]|nr:hypothetical protein N7U49_01890 [Streptomyces sp. AD2-2]
MPLADLASTVVAQVLRGYEAQLRQGGRISLGQVKSAVRWLCDQALDDLATVELPPKGAKTTYLRLWQRTLPLVEVAPATEYATTLVRLHILNPRYRGGSVDLRDLHASRGHAPRPAAVPAPPRRGAGIAQRVVRPVLR